MPECSYLPDASAFQSVCGSVSLSKGTVRAGEKLLVSFSVDENCSAHNVCASGAVSAIVDGQSAEMVTGCFMYPYDPPSPAPIGTLKGVAAGESGSVEFTISDEVAGCFEEGGLGGPWVILNGLSPNVWSTPVPFNIVREPGFQDDEIARCERGDCSVVQGGSTNSEGGALSGLSLSPFGAGMGPNLGLSYNSHASGDAPASLGWGWHLNVFASLAVDGMSGDLRFFAGNGHFERWVDESGDFVRAHANNYVEAVQNQDDSYTLTFKNQTRMNFDSEGKLVTVVDRNGNTTTYTYSDGLLQTVTDGKGRTLYVDYGSRTDGQPVSIRAQNPTTGRQVQFLYYESPSTAEDRLWKVVDPEGDETEFIYNGDNRLYQVKDSRGLVAVQFVYYTEGDYAGRVETETFYGERENTYTYNDPDNTITVVSEDLTTISDPDTRTTVLTLNRRRRVTKIVDPLNNVFEFEYLDSEDPYLMTARIDPNLGVTRMAYNMQGNLSAITDAQGRTTTFEYTDELDAQPMNPKRRNLLRKIHRPTVLVNGSFVTYPPTELEYDSDGNLIEIIDARGESTEFELSSEGWVESITDRNGHVTTFTYTSSGNLETITTPGTPGVSDPARTVTFTYNQYDQLETVTDELDNEWAYEFDDNNRPTKITDARGEYVNFTYQDGLLQAVTAPANQNPWSSSSRRETSYEYETTTPRLEQIEGDVEPSVQILRARFEYDGFSNLHQLVRKMGGVDKATEYAYDVLDRVTSVTDPLSRTAIMGYDPFCGQFTETTARDVERVYSRDLLCRLTRVEVDSQENAYVYDELGRLVKVTQRFPQPEKARYGEAQFGQNHYVLAHRRTFLYDELDRLVKVTFEGGQTIDYAYDNEGNLVSLTDVHGNVTEYTYNNDDRLRDVIVKRNSEDDRVFTYSYDAAGRLAEILYPEDTEIKAAFDDGAMNPNPGWNENGQLTHLRYLKKDGMGVYQHFHSFEYEYDPSGNRKKCIDTPENTSLKLTWEYGYDFLNRLVEVKLGEDTDTPTVQRVYEYDESDNRTFLDDHVNEVTYRYLYDEADQLLEIQHTTDPGDFESRDPGDFTTLEELDYDDDGNCIQRTLDPNGTPVVTDYTWNEFDSLVEIDGPLGIVTNDYDDAGLRKKKTDSASAERESFFSGLTNISEVEDAAGTPVDLSYLRGHQLLGFDRAGSFFYLLTDGLGSVRVLLDNIGSEVAAYSFEEFGARTITGSDSSPKTFIGALGVHDDSNDTELFYMRARHYDTTLGRFLSRDPLSAHPNPYAYVANNPVNFVDPRGLESETLLSDIIAEYYMIKQERHDNYVSRFTPEEFALIAEAVAIVNRCAVPCTDGKSPDLEMDSIIPFSPLMAMSRDQNWASTWTPTGTIRLRIDKIMSIKDPHLRLGMLVKTLANELYHVRNPWDGGQSGKRNSEVFEAGTVTRIQGSCPDVPKSVRDALTTLDKVGIETSLWEEGSP